MQLRVEFKVPLTWTTSLGNSAEALLFDIGALMYTAGLFRLRSFCLRLEIFMLQWKGTRREEEAAAGSVKMAPEVYRPGCTVDGWAR